MTTTDREDAGVVIVGGGQAGAEVAWGLRAGGYTGPVTMLGAEPELPYERPPLSKGVLAGTHAATRLPLRAAAAYEARGVDVRLGCPVVALDAERRTLRTADGTVLGYGTCVLATGARPIAPPWNLPGRVHCLREVADARAIASRAGAGRRFLVVGGGFLGLEAAASLRALGVAVTLVEAAPRVLPGKGSDHLAQWLSERHQAAGVDVRLGTRVADLKEDGDGLRAYLDDGADLAVDDVIFAAGVRSAAELAERAGARVLHGVVVDQLGRTSLPGVYAAGDLTSTVTAGGREVRLESVANALAQARAVVAAILGAQPRARRTPTFWSEQFGLRLQQAGWVPRDVHTTDVVTERTSESWVVERYLSGVLVAVETLAKPVQFARLLPAITDLRTKL